MSKTQTTEARDASESAIDGMAQAILARRREQFPSSLFRIQLRQPRPSDPRGDLPALAAMTAAYREHNDRMALGLKIGFAEVERKHGKSGE